MPTNGLIVFTPIKPGHEHRLRELLNPIGNDINGRRMATPRPHIDFTRSKTVHFARMAICDDLDRGLDCKRLLLATDYDGDLATHINDLWHITTDPEAIWRCCEGFESEASFIRFIHERSVKPQVYYMAFPGWTTKQIKEGELLRKRLEAWLHTPEARALAGAVGPFNASTVWARLAQAAEGALEKAGQAAGTAATITTTGLDALGIMARLGPLHAINAARQINASIERVPWIRLFNTLTWNKMPAPRHRYSTAPLDTLADCEPAEAGDEVVSHSAWSGVPSEDLVSQNQLTLISVIRPGNAGRLQAVLAMIDLYARRLSPPGQLVGISTIHTVRWAIIDNDRRFLMLSNYDGTWESYIDEFAELIPSGLNALWDTSLGFPDAGSQDIAALKHFLRCHQVPANVFYCAYPTATVQNIVENDRVGKALRRRLGGLQDIYRQ
jgi:hypothetical protein